MSDDVIVFVAGQLGVDAEDLGFYEWSGSTIEYHRAQIRDHLGYRVATVADQERLTGWLSEAVAHAERRPDRVREELLAEFRRLRIEPPTAGRILRMVRSALRTAEQNWASRIAGQLNPSATARLLNLIATSEDDDPDDVNDGSVSLLGLIKASPGNVSLESMMTEIGSSRRSGHWTFRLGCSPTSPRKSSTAGGPRPRWRHRRIYAVTRSR